MDGYGAKPGMTGLCITVYHHLRTFTVSVILHQLKHYADLILCVQISISAAVIIPALANTHSCFTETFQLLIKVLHQIGDMMKALAMFLKKSLPVL